MPPAEHQSILGPDDLAADIEPAGDQAVGHPMISPMPCY
jgi:hypothetical protein